MSYKAYLFDFDYTLVNSEKGITGCFSHTLAELGYKAAAYDTIRNTIGLPMETAVAQLIGTAEKQAVAEFITHYRRYADTYMTPNTHFYPETLPLLHKLKERGAKLAIVSSKTEFRIREKLQADKVEDLFSLVIGCEAVKEMKPSPEGILQALAVLQLAKQDILYTGDNIVDARAAEAAGVDFAAVTTGTTPANVFASLPHKAVLANLAGVAEL